MGSNGDSAQLLLLGSAQALNASEASHSEIKVNIKAQNTFSFPLGKQDRYLPLYLSEGDTELVEVS